MKSLVPTPVPPWRASSSHGGTWANLPFFTQKSKTFKAGRCFSELDGSTRLKKAYLRRG